MLDLSSDSTATTPSTNHAADEDEDSWASDVSDCDSSPTPKAKASAKSNPPSTSSYSIELLNPSELPCLNQISACLVDPFETLPIDVDEITNQLLHFYGQNSYWQTAYALSSKIKPSIKGSWEYQAGVCVTHFHILMARSALHQLRMNKHVAPKTQKQLEYASLKHQDQALAALMDNVSLGPSADLEKILTSCISLATFEQRYGNRQKALVHFKAGREVIKLIGFQNGLNGRLREEQALWFEGIYRDPGASFIWSTEDANDRLGWLNSLILEVDRIWRDRQLLPLEEKEAFLSQQTRLYGFLHRDTDGKFISVYSDIDEAIAQQRCVLILVAIITALYRQLDGKSQMAGPLKTRAITSAITAYADWIESMLVEHDLGQDQAVADMMWIMVQNYWDVKPPTATVGASQCLSRLDLRDCHWRACGIANVVKYLPATRQAGLRDYLLAFVGAKRYMHRLHFTKFEFSYAGESIPSTQAEQGERPRRRKESKADSRHSKQRLGPQSSNL